jgi:hypothetical protein
MTSQIQHPGLRGHLILKDCYIVHKSLWDTDWNVLPGITRVFFRL